MRITNVHFYDDIIDLPHHVSKKHVPMSQTDRAAQFGSFAALAGHSDAIKETARLTRAREELSEYVIEILDAKLQIIKANIAEKPLVTLCYFVPDSLKDGGEYITVTAGVTKIDEYEKTLILDNGDSVPIDMIREIESEIIRFDDGFYNL